QADLLRHSHTWIEGMLREDTARVASGLEAGANPARIGWGQVLAIMFLSERGIVSPRPVLDLLGSHPHAPGLDALTRCVEIAEALGQGDNIRLAAAIDAAEAHGLIPHAARMRILLAQRTLTRAPLERARPVLAGLGDRQFLRRLEEVEATLRRRTPRPRT